MLNKALLYISILLLFSCQTEEKQSPKTPNPSIETFPISFNIRALYATDVHTAWYAGYEGQVGYTEDGGKTWHKDSIRLGEYIPQFRSIAITDKAIFIMSTGSPAIVFKSIDKGENWDIMYQENHPDCYYNSMKFWDDQNGIAIGDYVDGCLSVIITRDGGDSWQKLPCDQLPPSDEGEGGFAASNTNIDIVGDHVWFVSGGAKARIFHSPDKGKTWEVYDTPINQGGKMTGIFSVDFRDDKNGIIFGGDWEKQTQNTLCKAMTTDGGKSWKLIGDGQEPAFRSCVQYVPQSNGQEILAVGMPGVSYSPDGGKSWQVFSTESFYTIRIVTGNTAWLAGKEKIAYMTW